MPSKLLKIVAPFGVSTAKGAYVAHRVDTERTRVVWYPDHPERTKYLIRFVCNSTERAGKTRFFKKPPRGYKPCKSCDDPLEVARWRWRATRRR